MSDDAPLAKGQLVVTPQHGLGRGLDALLAAMRLPARMPQLDSTPSATDLQDRLNALSAEVRALRARLDQLLEQPHSVGEATTSSIIDAVVGVERQVLQFAMLPIRQVAAAGRRIQRLLRCGAGPQV
jgi:hypothetical protein